MILAIIIGLSVIAVLAVGFIVLELDVRGHRSARYLVPLFLTAILIAVLVGINRGIRFTAEFFSTEAIWGFLAGCLFCAGIYYLVRWLEPSRPRGGGSSADQ